MIYPFEIDDTIWHGYRYWKTDSLEDSEVSGWNAAYFPCRVMRLTPKRIIVKHEVYNEIFHLNRQRMEHDGCQHHTGLREYFFAQKPSFMGDYIGRFQYELEP
jgi:hypothetical protein